MTELSDDVKTYIVTELAMYRRPAQVVAGVKALYGVTIKRQNVQFYDPTKGADDKRLGVQWVNLFKETRSRFDSETASIPVAKQSYRLAMLQRMAEKAETKQQFEVAGRLLEQVAKERGGLYTNMRQIKIDDPRSLMAELLGVRPEQLPDDLVSNAEN